MKFRSVSSGTRTQPSITTKDKREPLSDTRFQDLLSKAGKFFAEAERDVDGERAAVIAEILDTLKRHDLTLDDLK